MHDSECVTPLEEYVPRLWQREKQLVNIRALHGRLWIYLTIAAAITLVVAYIVFFLHAIPMFWIFVPIAGAVISMQALVKNANLHGNIQRIVDFYELGIDRWHHRWCGRGIGGEKFRPDTHVYASDLDLFGKGSLFELLCTARTSIGRATLARWLLNPAVESEIAERQRAVAELRNRLELREDWASIAGYGLDQAGSTALHDWAEGPSLTFSSHTQILAIALPVCLAGLLILFHAGIFGHYLIWLGAALLGMQILVAVVLRKKTTLTAADISLPAFELALLAPLFARFEKENFQCPLLKLLQSQLSASSGNATRHIRILRRLVWLLDLRKSEYFALPSSLLLWGTNFGILVERWRQRNRKYLGQWLDSLGQFEALLCLARYYYENPGHTFAVTKPQSPALFRAENLGHPLLDRGICVRCDLQLEAEGIQLMMVSGSNMSGKSTLLRSVGVNAVLALAGAPVCATRLEISRLQIACSIGVQDSPAQSKSRFQAEVERLKSILILSRTNNTLFLLDELLSGTNSNDRCYGAKAMVEQLVANGAIGLVTTHDLALTEVAKAAGERAINVHFQERYENGEMQFDYKMRTGVLTSTNGVNIMAALGLLTLPERK